MHQAHGVVTARALFIVVEEALSDHPLEASLEVPSDAEHLKVPLEAVLYDISLNHLRKVGFGLVIIQEGLVEDLPPFWVGVLHLVISEGRELLGGWASFQLILEVPHVLIEERDRCFVIIQGLLVLKVVGIT